MNEHFEQEIKTIAKIQIARIQLNCIMNDINSWYNTQSILNKLNFEYYRKLYRSMLPTHAPLAHAYTCIEWVRYGHMTYAIPICKLINSVFVANSKFPIYLLSVVIQFSLENT